MDQVPTVPESRAKQIEKEYLSSLADLNVNSKPLINMLTILAEENLEYAQIIVNAVEKHLAKVTPDVKLPILYLVDSIVKNVGKQYQTLFSQVIVNMFCGVFQTVNEKIREKMFSLRQTWNEVFQQAKLYTLDVKINSIDPGWPITAQLKPTIHFNPMFLTGNQPSEPNIQIQQELRSKQRELLELQARKLELELLTTKKRIAEQEKQLSIHTASVAKEPSSEVRRNVETSGPTPLGLGPAGGLISTSVPPPAVSKSRIAPVPPGMISMMKTRDPRLAKQHAAAQLSGPPSAKSTGVHNHAALGPMTVPPPALLPGMVEPSNANSPMKSSLMSIKDRLGEKVRRLEPADGGSARVESSMEERSGARSKKTTPSSPSGSSASLKSRHDHDVKPRKDRKEHSSGSSSSSSRSSTKSKSSSSSRTGISGTEKRKQRTPSNSDHSPQGRKSPHSPGKKKSSHHSQNDGKGAGKPRSDSKSSPPESVSVGSKVSHPPRNNADNKKHLHLVGEPAGGSVGALVDGQDVDFRFGIPQKRIKIDETVSEHRSVADEKDAMMLSMVGQKASEVQNNSATDDEEALSAMIAKDIDLRAIPLQLNRLADREPPSNGGLLINHVEKGRPAGSSSNPSDEVEDRDDFPGLKKRGSTNNSEEPTAKKSKAEMLDALFGNEDVDLRQLPIGGTLLMSGDDAGIDFPKGENAADRSRSPLSEKTNNHGESMRTKMVDVGKAQDKDKLGRPLLYNKLPDDPIERRRSINSLTKPGDVDFRHSQPIHHGGSVEEDEDNSMDSMNANIKTIIAQAQDQMEKGEITPEQYNILMKQVIQLNETQKIRQAQRIEHVKRQDQVIPIDDNATMSDEDDVIVTSVTPGTKTPGLGDNSTGVGNDFRGKIYPIDGKPHSSIPPFEAPFAAMGIPSTSVPPPDIRAQRDPRRMRESKWNRAEPGSAWATRPPGAGVAPVAVGPLPVPPLAGGLRGGPGMPVPSPWEQAPFPVLDNTPRFPAAPVVPLGMLGGPAANGQSMLIPAVAKMNDSVRTINIDGIQREIRFYEETAVIFMNWDEPKEIGFQKGARMVTVDDRETFELGFNEPYKSVSIEGKIYQMRLGAPTRELYIDDSWYECYFGEPPTTIVLDGKPRVFKISGPAPQVKIGDSRKDLVSGRINMIIDAKYIVQVFLDCKVQMFEVYGHTHRLQFADFLLTVLIDDQPFPADYGGLPMLCRSRERDYYIRFTALPKLVEPGRVYIRDMIRTPLYRDLRTPPKDSSNLGSAMPLNPPFGPSPGGLPGMQSSGPPGMAFGPLNSSIPPPGIGPMQSGPNATSTGLDYLTNLMPSMAMQPGASGSPNVMGYRIEADEKAATSGQQGAGSSATGSNAGGQSLLSNINVSELYKKIVAAGIITKLGGGSSTSSSPTPPVGSGASSSVKEPKEEASKSKEKDNPSVPAIEPVLLDKPDSLKRRQAAVVHQLFSGMQCSSCGVRFPPEQTMKYSQHLDWHFRQNRRDRDSARKAHSRKWYYDVSDWIQYEEIEDLEEREKNWFETQQTDQGDLKKGGGGGGIGGLGGDGDEFSSHIDSPHPSCPAGSDETDRQCHMCHDVFDQFYNEETEDWHLRNAVRIDGSTYHPLCYEDYKASLTMSESTVGNDTTLGESQKTDQTMDTDEAGDDGERNPENGGEDVNKEGTRVGKKGEGSDVDDDDDVIVLPAVEPVVQEILDDDMDGEKTTPDKDIDEETPASSGPRQPEFQERQVDDDVFIKEPNIEVTDLDEIDDHAVKSTSQSGNGADVADENSLSSLLRVKIKEEPIEEDEADEEDALFEDVGTIESSLIEVPDNRSPMTNAVEEELYDDVVAESIPSPSEASNQTGSLLQGKASIDGNVELQDAPATSAIVPNKIKINITTTKANAVGGASNHGATSTNDCDASEAGNNGVGSGANCNDESQGVGTDGAAVDHRNDGAPDEQSNEGAGSWEENEEGRNGSEQFNNKESSASTKATTATAPAVIAFEETTDVAYELKEALKGIDLNRRPRVTSGYEASGLCSIM